jgi:hypothetical protein
LREPLVVEDRRVDHDIVDLTDALIPQRLHDLLENPAALSAVLGVGVLVA